MFPILTKVSRSGQRRLTVSQRRHLKQAAKSIAAFVFPTRKSEFCFRKPATARHQKSECTSIWKQTTSKLKSNDSKHSVPSDGITSKNADLTSGYYTTPGVMNSAYYKKSSRNSWQTAVPGLLCPHVLTGQASNRKFRRVAVWTADRRGSPWSGRAAILANCPAAPFPDRQFFIEIVNLSLMHAYGKSLIFHIFSSAKTREPSQFPLVAPDKALEILYPIPNFIRPDVFIGSAIIRS